MATNPPPGKSRIQLLPQAVLQAEQKIDTQSQVGRRKSLLDGEGEFFGGPTALVLVGSNES